MATNENPDFIALDMDPTTINAAPDAADDFIALDMGDAPSALAMPEETPTAETATENAPSGDGGTLESALSAIVAPVTGNASGSLTSGTMAYVGFTTAQGYVTALQNGVKQATADQYKATLRRVYSWTEDQIAALQISIIPDGAGTTESQNPTIVTHDGPNIFEQRRAARGLASNARMPQATREVQAAPVAPVVEGILPRTQILKDLAEKAPGVKLAIGKADRRMTHHTISEITEKLGEFSSLAPKLKTSKAQFGETMRGLKMAYAENSAVVVWNITRRDVARVNQEWPADLVSRWCVGVRDGSDDLGSLGSKTLVADLLVDGSIRFVGGTDEIRDRVIGTFAAKVGGGVFNSTDLLTWFRKTVSGEFYGIEVTGGYYVPGSHEAGERLDRFVTACLTFLGRDVGIDDVITGKRLAASLTNGLARMLQEIESDFSADQEKARERDAAKALKANPQATESDLDLAKRRAVVLPERANHYLVRLSECQSYLDGLAKLVGDDTAGVKATLARLDGMVRPLADALVVELD